MMTKTLQPVHHQMAPLSIDGVDGFSIHECELYERALSLEQSYQSFSKQLRSKQAKADLEHYEWIAKSTDPFFDPIRQTLPTKLADVRKSLAKAIQFEKTERKTFMTTVVPWIDATIKYHMTKGQDLKSGYGFGMHGEYYVYWYLETLVKTKSFDKAFQAGYHRHSSGS